MRPFGFWLRGVKLMAWRGRSSRRVRQSRVSAGWLVQRLGQVGEIDLEPTEIGRLLQEKRAEYYAGLTEFRKGSHARQDRSGTCPSAAFTP